MFLLTFSENEDIPFIEDFPTVENKARLTYVGLNSNYMASTSFSYFSKRNFILTLKGEGN